MNEQETIDEPIQENARDFNDLVFCFHEMPEKTLPSKVASQLVNMLEEQVASDEGLAAVFKAVKDRKLLVVRLLQFFLVIEWLHQLSVSVSTSDERNNVDLREWLRAHDFLLREFAKECELPDVVVTKRSILSITSFLRTLCKKLEEHESPTIDLPVIFHLLEQDLLGEIYKTSLTNHEKRSVGIYHTPWEIIDFIISVTVQKQLAQLEYEFRQSLVNGKLDGLRTTWEKIRDYRVIDPACGSGRFIIRVIPHLVKVHSTLLQLVDQHDNRNVLVDDLALEKSQFLQLLPFHVVMWHLHGIDLAENAVFTCRLNACLQVFTECLRYDIPSVNENAVFKDFLLLFKVSKLNFHVGDALVGCFPRDGIINVKEKNDHQFLAKLDVNLFTPLDTMPRRALKALLQYDELTPQINDHLRKTLQEQNFSDSIFEVSTPYCWYFMINRPRVPGFDAVLGNPPYFRIREISRKNLEFRVVYQYLKTSTRWSRFFRAASDVYYYFILLGLQLLKPRGKLGYIVGNYWIDNDNADLLKKELLFKSRLDFLVQFSSRRVFEGVNEDTCVLVLTKKESRKDDVEAQVRYFLIESIDLLKNISVNNIYFKPSEEKKKITEIRIPQHLLGTKKWILRDHLAFPTNLKIDGKKIVPLGDVKPSTVRDFPILFKNRFKFTDEMLQGLCLVGRGMQSGRNDIFRVQLLQDLDDDVVLIRNPKFGLTAKIEKKFLKRAVRNSFIGRYHLKTLEWIIFIPPRLKIDDYPLLRDYLMTFEDQLKKRYEFKKGTCKWYEYSIYRNLALQQAPHYLLAPYRSKLNVFARNVEPIMVFDDCVIIVPKNNQLEMARYLLGVLNSSVVLFWLSLVGKRKGNLFELFSTVLARIPIPNPEKHVIFEINDAVSNLEKMFLKATKFGDGESASSRKKNIFFRSQQRELESFIDALVFQLYGFTSRDLRDMLRKIGQDEERMRMVLSFFRK